MLMEADLPEDVDALRALVIEQARKLESADAEVERLSAIIEAFRCHRFGRRSEQFDPDQLGLEDAETALAEAEAANEVKAGRPRSDRPRMTNRGSLPAHLERIEQIVDIEARVCPCCGDTRHQIGEDVTERLDVVPTTFRVLVILGGDAAGGGDIAHGLAIAAVEREGDAHLLAIVAADLEPV